jgi:hypothetical protein
MGLWWNQAPGCFWCATHGAYTPEAFERYLQGLAKRDDSAHLLIVGEGSRAPAPHERARLSEVLKQVESRVRACAYVSDSAVFRGAITAVHWLKPLEYETKTFRDPGDALQWLALFAPDTFRPQLVKADILHRVPAEALCRAWKADR